MTNVKRTYYVTAGRDAFGKLVGNDEDFPTFEAAARDAKRMMKSDKAIHAVSVVKITRDVIATFHA